MYHFGKIIFYNDLNYLFNITNVIHITTVKNIKNNAYLSTFSDILYNDNGLIMYLLCIEIYVLSQF